MGLPPRHPRRRPLLGPGPLDGLWLATGHYRNGVLLAAITAELIATGITGTSDGQAAALLADFRWDRPFPAPA